MKVLILNCVYAFGSTGKIVQDIAAGLCESKVNVIVAYGRGGAVAEQWPVIKLATENTFKLQSLASKITGYTYSCSPVSTHNFVSLLKKEKPDVVNLHCANANTVDLGKTISYLKHHHIKTVLSVHAEFLYTGGCGYSYDCMQWIDGCVHCPQFHKPDSQLPESWIFNRTSDEWRQLRDAYDGFKELVVICVSPWLADRARQSPMFRGRKIISVINGLDEDVFKPCDPSRLRHRHNLEGKKVILHVTPNFYSKIKGGNYVLEIAKRLEAEHPDYALIICGYKGDGVDLPNNVVTVPFTRDQMELAEYYSLADVTLLTSKRETFSMVTAETLCCGTPMVAFKAGGPESIALKEGTLFCEYGDVEALYSSVVDVLSGKKKLFADSEKARKVYSKGTMKESYLKVYEDLVNHC